MSAFDDLKARDEQSICNTYGRYPLAIDRAQGCHVWDLDGKRYLDLVAGIAVCSLGHSRPELLEVITRQYAKLVHVSNLFYQREQSELAERLLATSHAGKVFFCNSGAEANEAAIKLARRFMRTVRGREAYEILTLSGSFHGRTLATVTATGQEKFRQYFEPLPGGFTTVPKGDLEAMRAAMGPQTAAVLVEVVQGEGGVRPLDGDYLRAVQALCRERDVLFMIDEVQTGMCRTGRFWAHQHHGLTPDVFTVAKPLAGGLPMGAMFATDEAARGLTPGTHATTFGGGALLCAVAAKVVDIMLDEDLAGRAEAMGAYARELFAGIAARNPGAIAEVRGLGLMLAVDLGRPAADVWRALLDRGFICNLTQETALRLVPPLVITREDLDAFAAALEDILRARP
ncbi:aspartate aminotransferase family protein [Desulfocurvus vexinensis]|uniref:aspartate aminotransferase family protein n=1 Tax=Desulfocurvus vexinensis TaxID=399548 RepID=UPI000490BFF2|nr:aspartate aminotransferase family protein [Desulfocurvus vexinensis]